MLSGVPPCEHIKEPLMLSGVLMELSRIPQDHDQQILDQQHLYRKSVDCVNDSTHRDAGAVTALKV